MKRPVAVVAALIGVALSLVRLNAAALPTYEPDRILVLPQDAGALAALEAAGYTTLQVLPIANYRLMRIPSSKTVTGAVAELVNRGDIVAAQPNFIQRSLITPNDPSFVSQYHLAIINCTTAWDITTGSASETIAICDTGGDTKHPDLIDRVVFAPYSDQFDNDSDPSESISGTGHATNVAGCAAASTNNAADVAGVDWNARILFNRVLDASGSGSEFTVGLGIFYAVNNKASVINLSLGGSSSSRSEFEELLLIYAKNRGVPVICAAGNSGSSDSVGYPASSRHSIAVGASTSGDARASFSSYGSYGAGSHGVDIVAPGQGIITTNPGLGVTTGIDGTSFASPIVTGAVALLRSLRKEYSPDNIRTILRATAKDINTAGFDEETGYGRLDVFKLLDTARSNTVFPFANDTSSYRTDLFAGTLGDVRTASASATAGRQGRNGLVLSGDNVYVGYDSSVNRDTGSVEFFVRFDAVQPADTRFVLTQHGLAAKPKGSLDLVFTSDSKLQFSLQDSGVITSRTALLSGQWYHIALTYGVKGMILYVNGESEASKFVMGGPAPSDTIYLGAPTSLGGAKSARCQIEALRLSKSQRIIFPSALKVQVESVQSQAVNFALVTWTATQNETNAATIRIFADRDSSGFDGILLASDNTNFGFNNVPLAGLASSGDPFYIYIEATNAAYPNEIARAYSDTPFQAFSPLSALLRSTPSETDKVCLAVRTLPSRVLPWLRAMRDFTLTHPVGRLLTTLYYRLFT